MFGGEQWSPDSGVKLVISHGLVPRKMPSSMFSNLDFADIKGKHKKVRK